MVASNEREMERDKISYIHIFISRERETHTQRVTCSVEVDISVSDLSKMWEVVERMRERSEGSPPHMGKSQLYLFLIDLSLSLPL